MFLGCGLMGVNAKSSSRKQVSFKNEIAEFPIVGVGASGAVSESFKLLLESLPVDTGLAFVIIQHLRAARKAC